MKIRTQLLLLMVIALFITTSLVGCVQMYAIYNQDRDNMQSHLQNQANQLSNQVETWFTIIQQNGHFFVSQPFVKNATQDEMQKLIGNLHNEMDVFDNIIVAKPDGSITNIYPYNQKKIGKSIYEYAYFRETVALKSSQVSRVLTNDITGKAIIVITQPISNAKGELVAILVQNIKLDILQDMIEDSKIGKTGETIIFTANGQIMNQQNTPIYGKNTYVPYDIAELFKKDLRGVVQFLSDDGQQVVVAVNRVKTPGWGIAVTVRQAEVLQGFYDSAKYGIETFCVIFLLLSCICYAVFNRLFRSITIVTEQISSMNDGNFASAQISGDLIRTAPQELRQLCTTFNTMSETIQHNIEAIKGANQALRVSEERWQLALRGNTDGIWDWDIQKKEIFFSDRVKEMIGYTNTDILWNMDEWQQKIHPDDCERVQELLRNHLEQKSEFFSVEYRIQCKDQSFKWVFIRGQGVWDEMDVPVRVVGSITDITKRKQAEEELRQAYDQLELKVEIRTQDLLAMNQELQAVNQELENTVENLKYTQEQLLQSDKMASLGNLVAGIAHEINTPVGVGVTAATHLQKITKEFIQLYENGKLKRLDLTNYLADSDEAATIIFTNLERASQLIRSFKQVSVDQSSEARRVFNVGQYIGEILLSLQPKLKRTRQMITVQCEEKMELDSFPGAFAQIITNLIMNSLIHAYEPDDAGQIFIQVVKAGEKQVRLVYSDDGKGMEKEVLNKIFNPFFTTKRGMGGTGLGLYILYNIVTQQFGGTIDCISQPGLGAKFIIEFPVG